MCATISGEFVIVGIMPHGVPGSYNGPQKDEEDVTPWTVDVGRSLLGCPEVATGCKKMQKMRRLATLVWLSLNVGIVPHTGISLELSLSSRPHVAYLKLGLRYRSVPAGGTARRCPR